MISMIMTMMVSLILFNCSAIYFNILDFYMISLNNICCKCFFCYIKASITKITYMQTFVNGNEFLLSQHINIVSDFFKRISFKKTIPTECTRNCPNTKTMKQKQFSNKTYSKIENSKSHHYRCILSRCTIIRYQS